VLVAEAVVHFNLGSPGALHYLQGGGVLGDFGDPLVEVTGKVDRRGRLRRVFAADGDVEVGYRAGNVQHGVAFHFLRHPALHLHTVGGVDHKAGLVNRKRPRTSIQLFAGVVKYKEAHAGNGKVGLYARGLQASLNVHGVD